MRFNNCIVIQHNSRRLYKQPHWCQLCRPAKELINIFGPTEMRISYLHIYVYIIYVLCDISMVIFFLLWYYFQDDDILNHILYSHLLGLLERRESFLEPQ